MATPRSQGLVAEAQALVDAAGVLGDSDLIQQAQQAQQHVQDYVTAVYGTQWLHSDPQPELDALNTKIATAGGVSPLDLDSSANLSPTGAGNLSGWEQDLTGGTGGNWGAATADVAGDAAKAAANAATSGLKWLLLAAVALGALYIVMDKR